jgi:hypothetical protein
MGGAAGVQGGELPCQPNPEAIMDKDWIAGAAKQAKGSVTEAIANVADDSRTQVGGAAEKTAG